VQGGKTLRKYESRRITPWDEVVELTPTQSFLKKHYQDHYAERHVVIRDSDETELINSYAPSRCPHCGSEKFKKYGHTTSGVQRYKCSCRKTFLPTSGTVFDEHRISISEWMEYCLNLFRHVSITVDSWSNKNDYKTSRYWLQKLFLILKSIQDDIVLSGKIWFDETFYTVRSEDIVRKDNGNKLRGLSINQICIGVATDKVRSVLLVEGTGKPSQKKIFTAFGGHIERGATLIHDKESAHRKLVEKLELKSIAYASIDLKKFPDRDNPLNPVNRLHAILKSFLNSHSGFDRQYIQDYLNLFAFVSNPPHEMLEKVEKIINLAFQNPRLLRYRDFYGANTGFNKDDNNTMH
jgi:transposase-like protein